MTKISAEITVTVPFYDLDPMRVVWHGNYIKYLEDARCALLNEIGYNYVDMKDDNIAYPIAKLDVKYIKPCFFEQKLTIKAALKEYEPCLIINYEIVDADTGCKLLKAQTMQICIDINSKNTLYNAPEKLIVGVKKYA